MLCELNGRWETASSVPYSIVRATQFFEFLGAIGEAGAVGGNVVVPSALFQPIASDDVVDCLAEVATGPSAERHGRYRRTREGPVQ
jgi:uncharacterized protein YbjT (DUF2867 family)